jgi:hypothetical protein
MHKLERYFVVFKAREINLTAILLCVSYCELQLKGVEEMEVHTRHIELVRIVCSICRSQRPRGLMRRSTAARLLRLWVRIPPGPWMFVCRECCVLSGRGLCDELITRPEESNRLWCVVVCDLENSRMRRS